MDTTEPTPQTMKKARYMVQELERLNDVKFGNVSWEIIKKWMGRIDSEWMDDADKQDAQNYKRIQELEARLKTLEAAAVVCEGAIRYTQQWMSTPLISEGRREAARRLANALKAIETEGDE